MKVVYTYIKRTYFVDVLLLFSDLLKMLEATATTSESESEAN